MIPSQLLKGTLEGCILGVIGQKETMDMKSRRNWKAMGLAASPKARSIPCCCGWKRADASRQSIARRPRAPNENIIP